MYYELSSRVYWGNWESPFEMIAAGDPPKAIINVAHSFSARRGRNAYWARLEGIPWTTLYFRMALKDGQRVTDSYMTAILAAIDTVKSVGAFPLLCHCQMGGHRGPTAAMLAHWRISGCPILEAKQAIKTVRPGFGDGRNKDYHDSVVAYCWESDVSFTLGG